MKVCRISPCKFVIEIFVGYIEQVVQPHLLTICNTGTCQRSWILILISHFNTNLCIERERVYVHLRVCTYPAPYMSVGHYIAVYFILI